VPFEPSLMGVDDLGGLAQKGNFAHHLVTAFAVLFMIDISSSPSFAGLQRMLSGVRFCRCRAERRLAR